jgi:methyl-accepting chemotaxis protein
MSSLQTESLINKTRYVFTLMFIGVAASSYLQKSAPATWGGILGTSVAFLALALVNQVFISRKKISVPLIYVSVTVEITLIFILKFVMHFDERVGYGMTIKEPATFCVYFLFIILSALRFNKRLNIYMGVYSILTYILLVVLAVADGGMVFTADAARTFDKDTIRLASELPKIIFLGAFVFFISKMADFTTGNMKQLAEAETNANANYYELRSMLATIDQTAKDLLDGSNELSESSHNIDSVLSDHGELMAQVETIAKNFTASIEDIRGKASFQNRTVEENSSRIREISTLMETINGDSSSQREKAEHALRLADANEENISRTITAITAMKDNSQKIEEISRTISEIADKTNLLSLNAAIESARAGEHGRGFAVVADEISKLATMSIDSSKEIAAIIKNTVGTIENSSVMIGTLAENLGKIISFVKENSTFMKDLNDKTLNESSETRILYATSVEVEKAAKGVFELADRQTEFIREIQDWFKNMNELGGVVSGSLRGLQSLSSRLRERSMELKTTLDQK